MYKKDVEFNMLNTIQVTLRVKFGSTIDRLRSLFIYKKYKWLKHRSPKKNELKVN